VKTASGLRAADLRSFSVAWALHWELTLWTSPCRRWLKARLRRCRIGSHGSFPELGQRSLHPHWMRCIRQFAPASQHRPPDKRGAVHQGPGLPRTWTTDRRSSRRALAGASLRGRAPSSAGSQGCCCRASCPLPRSRLPPLHTRPDGVLELAKSSYMRLQVRHRHPKLQQHSEPDAVELPAS